MELGLDLPTTLYKIYLIGLIQKHRRYQLFGMAGYHITFRSGKEDASKSI